MFQENWTTMDAAIKISSNKEMVLKIWRVLRNAWYRFYRAKRALLIRRAKIRIYTKAAVNVEFGGSGSTKARIVWRKK